MSTDLDSDFDRDLDSGEATVRTSWRRHSIAAVLVGVIVLCGYFALYRPYWGPTGEKNDPAGATLAAGRSGGSPVAQQNGLTLDAAVEVMQNETARRYEDTLREVKDIKGTVKQLERVVADTNTMLRQGSHELGSSIAAKVFEKADLIPVKNRAEALAEKLDKLKSDYDVWITTRDDLLEGERGRPIAADDKLVALFANVQMPSVTELDIKSWTEVLPELTKPMKDALAQDQPSLIPLEAYTTRVDTLAKKIDQAATEIRRVRLEIAAIERQADRSTVTAETPRLCRALEDYTIRCGREVVRKRAEKAQQIRDELAKKLADADTKHDMAKVAMEIEAKQRRIERERRFQKALPEIRAYLQVYMAHGYAQPEGARMVRTNRRGPVSLSALRGTGALKTGAVNEYDLPLQTLVAVTTSGNDRPLGGFPRNVLPRRDLTYLRKVQGLLNEFGPLMVEKGMLAK